MADIEAHYTTLDAYVAGFLSLRGHQPQLEDQGGKIAFVFEDSEALQRSLGEYTSGVEVNALAYVFQVKGLKSRIHDMRRVNAHASYRYKQTT